MLSCENLSFSIGSKQIVLDLNFEMRPGKLTAIAGPNGAGKSTFLKLVAGEHKPGSGSISLEGKPLSQWSIKELAMRRAVMGQHSKIDFNFSSIEIVLMGRFPHQSTGLERPEDWDIASEAMRRVGVLDLAHRSFPVLSGGEQQRVQLARALAQIWEVPNKNQARYLFLDEPTASLDLSHQHQTLRIARELAANNTAVLVVLHDLNLVARYADEVLLLKEGNCVATGTPAAVLTKEQIHRVFEVDVVVRQDPKAGLVVLVE